MMQKEKEFFLQILADYLNDRVTGAQENLDWSVLESIGEAQNLTGVIYHQCKNMIAQSDLPPLVKKKWKMGFVYNSFLYSKRLALLKQVDAAFQKENIPYFIFKGTELAKLYPAPAQRTMGDSDLFVHEEDMQRACEALGRLGFVVEDNSSFGCHVSKDKTIIDLQSRLVNVYSTELDDILAWENKVWEYTVLKNGKAQGQLDPTYHLVYVILHLRKHMIIKGVGFRQFMDAAVLASQPEINWKQAELWLKELHLVKFSQICFAFCRRWFDIKIPAGKLELSDDFYNEFTETMLAGGVFGGNDEKFTGNAVFNEAYFVKSSRIKAFLRQTFLPYKEMCLRPYCKFLNGRPYLLPVAWCLRLVYGIYAGHLVPLIKGAFDNETIKEKKERLSKWGL